MKRRGVSTSRFNSQVVAGNQCQGIVVVMGKRKPDFMWVLALVVALGAASSALMGGEEPRMLPQQAGIIVR
jgi:hypothetical protein